MPPIEHYQKIIVCGTTGSGKSTMAKNIAAEKGIPYIEMDALFWNPGWVKTPEHVVEEKLDHLSSQPSWVFDGNYSKMRHLTWERAELLIWLDYSFFRLFYQVTKRTIENIRTKKTICNGNFESIRLQFFSKKSIYVWLCRSYFSRRKKMKTALHDPRYAHLKIIHLKKTPSQ